MIVMGCVSSTVAGTEVTGVGNTRGRADEARIVTEVLEINET